MLEKITAGGKSDLDPTHPDLRGSFMLDSRKVLVFTKPEPKLTSLETIMKAYPRGIDSRDMVWMWKRALGAVWLAHSRGVVHGSLVPPNILLDLEGHSAHLINWTASAPIGGKIKLKHLSYPAWYPRDAPEASIGLDLYMLATSMDDVANSLVPESINRLIVMCLSERPEGRPRDAGVFHAILDSVIRETFGSPKFRKFTLPEGAG
jgi:hypothetical protein